MMHSTSATPSIMAAAHYIPPAGRQSRPRRKSLEQLEAKYKSLMQNMLLYQQMKKRNMCREAGGATGTAAGAKTDETVDVVEQAISKGQIEQPHTACQSQPALPTPLTPLVSSASSTTNEDVGVFSGQIRQHHHHLRHQQHQQQQHHRSHSSHQDHRNVLPPLRDPKREHHPQKRLQNAHSSGPKPAYERREAGRHGRGPSRPIPAAIQLVYEELVSLPQQQQQQQQQQKQKQQHHESPPPQPQQQQQQQQQHRESAPGNLPPTTYLRQQYMPSHFHPQHVFHPHPHQHQQQQLATPVPTPPHLVTAYSSNSMHTLAAPYSPSPYDPTVLQPHVDHHHHHHQQQYQRQHQSQQQQQQQHFDSKDGLLDSFAPDMDEL